MSKQREDDYDGIQTPQLPQGASTSVPLPRGEKAIEIEFSFASMYRYADGKDKLLLAIGLLCAVVNGSALPFMAVVFGNSVNAFVAPIDFDKVHTVTLQFLLMAIGLFVTGFGFFDCFAIAAERQMKKLRCEFFKHIMHQEMAWYDQRNASELASRLAGDTIKMKEGMGTKLGEALRFVCQFIAGYAIGFSYGWNLSLVMYCVMPLLALSLTLLMKRLRDSAVRSQ
ncbi:hypothetical protein LEN26_007662 [Aphanomyces euteiches]|nr:hypothetical protein AeMF1_005724 [Aphanomyces euteiches]KAH9131556.1 hypothetical protein LEN26_007662 [Aphanomyces euteiches]